ISRHTRPRVDDGLPELSAVRVRPTAETSGNSGYPRHKYAVVARRRRASSLGFFGYTSGGRVRSNAAPPSNLLEVSGISPLVPGVGRPNATGGPRNAAGPTAKPGRMFSADGLLFAIQITPSTLPAVPLSTTFMFAAFVLSAANVALAETWSAAETV